MVETWSNLEMCDKCVWKGQCVKHVKTGQQGQDCDQGLCGKLCKKATGTSQESHYDRRSTTSTSPPSTLPRGHGQDLKNWISHQFWIQIIYFQIPGSLSCTQALVVLMMSGRAIWQGAAVAGKRRRERLLIKMSSFTFSKIILISLLWSMTMIMMSQNIFISSGGTQFMKIRIEDKQLEH